MLKSKILLKTGAFDKNAIHQVEGYLDTLEE
jgi:hypothetical protein